METRTYRAKSIQEALAMIRRDLGPDASVLHTRELSGGILRWMTGNRQLEVTASSDIQVPSRILQTTQTLERTLQGVAVPLGIDTNSRFIPPAHEVDYRARFRNNLRSKASNGHSVVEDLCEQHDRSLAGRKSSETNE